jgi:CheY-like chemotaxis protein
MSADPHPKRPSSKTSSGLAAYLKLAVRDKGVGMDADVLSHLFEPFFTTKPMGQGLGLGLSTVYGAVRRSSGFIDVDSDPGQGTVLTIYFPRWAAAPKASSAPPLARTRSAPARGGGETLLVAEDDEDLRELITEFLESQGYRVLSGTDGRDALRIALEHTGPIDLLLTDVMMPFMAGPELATRMLRERPGLRLLFMSGYVGEFAQSVGAFGPNAVLLRKPFSLDALAHAVRECLASAT